MIRKEWIGRVTWVDAQRRRIDIAFGRFPSTWPVDLRVSIDWPEPHLLPDEGRLICMDTTESDRGTVYHIEMPTRL